ncbi:GMP synthase, small subunit [Methanoregula boonei 6A8]|jgi:GMP synthase (glutamine-hydrolysing)|uniref:GMP synthase [glutamine-hydrolyzing] subunit A n=1 Tax=Methanoregula boonei (strain DSM 21154 / JCM 14090 / 6A8) TaxID=456442 RepID=GUAAA_METB6|nr:GMP synthase subunit A [Methanoregula boonei]A7I661.1 RecName: Full=GMP synthase [glutamine-hydrolyzing] subunit A; AltName: Full=Glutamine amidotransferase [Methanoregula boonei 6A8]ABS55222.1 GMP synthase, small subunit [Methanoregula boonei 6A8]
MLPICVVNNYGQFNHLIHRALRDLDIDAVLIPNTTPREEIASQYRGIILGGGPDIARAGVCAEYLDLGIPVLGICLGLHIIARKFGGVVHPGKSGGYGSVEVTIREHDDILSGYPDIIPVWASHADEVCRIPEGFTLLASSGICEVEAVACPRKRIYGLQWHPEVSHTVGGKRVYENFDAICTE